MKITASPMTITTLVHVAFVSVVVVVVRNMQGGAP